MKKILRQAWAKTLVKAKLIYILLGWHLLVWFIVFLLIPSYWAYSLLLTLLLYAGTLFLVLYHSSRRSAVLSSSASFISPALQIANETLPILRGGLTEENAKRVVEIIKKISDIPAVAITDREKVLAFMGVGCENHPVGTLIATQPTLDVIMTGKQRIVSNKSEFHCRIRDCKCSFESAVIVPLDIDGYIAGTLKLYQTKKGNISEYIVKLAEGISQLLSMQIKLAEFDHQSRLITEARLDALHAQINPHFLFNTLNTIGALTRTNPSIARRLIYRLASFFRQSLRPTGRFLQLKDEMECVRNYLILERARFRDRLSIIRDIDKKLFDRYIPVLSIQPLVENAIRHGITPKEGPGVIKIQIFENDQREIEIIITDNGAGIPPDVFPHALEPGFGSGSGVGLSNVNDRLKLIYGEGYGLNIRSEQGSGTTVSLKIPEHAIHKELI